MSVEKIKAIMTIAIVVGYAVIAISLRYLNPNDPEVYPIFAWRLFAGIPNNKTEFVVEITKYNGITLNKPIAISEAEFLESSRSVSARKLVQDFAYSYTSNKDYKKYKNGLETLYLEKTDEYRLVRVTYNPIEKYHKSESSKNIIANFKTNAK